MKQNYFVPIKGALFCGLLWLMSTVAFAQKSVSLFWNTQTLERVHLKWRQTSNRSINFSDR